MHKASLTFLFLLLFSMTIIYTYVFYSFYSTVTVHKKLRQPGHYGSRMKIPQLFQLNTTKKFVVLTTIQMPTAQVMRLAQEPGWTVVVVADKKTPIGWYLPGVHHISVRDQQTLGYSVAKKIPFGSYTRKMIGYLYAIQRGAEWIYDTDDDNKPYGKGLNQFDYGNERSGLVYRRMNSTKPCSTLFQPYAYFGQPGIWPRGFPLQKIKHCENDDGKLLLCSKIKTPVIQQGLAGKDPDVDAMFRILNADETTGLNVTFSKHAPPITLAPGIYSPFNSQNTLFHRSAFFTLWFPTSVAFRVTDIWRSYYAQKLIHLIGETVAFYPTNVVHLRNAHNYISDMKEEIQLYEDAGRLVKFIDDWECKYAEIAACAIQLAEDFTKHGFWSESDAEIARLWINDLITLHYSFPKQVAKSTRELLDQFKAGSDDYRYRNCRSAKMSFKLTSGTAAEFIQRESNAIANYRELNDWCAGVPLGHTAYPDPNTLFQAHSKTTLAEYKEMALIITFNSGMFPGIALLQRMYEPFFALTVFCGTMMPNNFSAKVDAKLFPKLEEFNYIDLSLVEMWHGFYAYYCTALAIKLGLQNIKGFVTISDDTLLNLWTPFQTSRFIIMRRNNMHSNVSWWASRIGLPALKETVKTINSWRSKGNDDTVLKQYEQAVGESISEHLMKIQGWCVADYYFLPADAKSLEMFQMLADLMFKSLVFHEIAMAKIADGFIPDITQPMEYLWSLNRLKWYEAWKESLLILHPIKLVPTASNKKRKNDFCNLLNRFKHKIFHVY